MNDLTTAIESAAAAHIKIDQNGAAHLARPEGLPEGLPTLLHAQYHAGSVYQGLIKKSVSSKEIQNTALLAVTELQKAMQPRDPIEVMLCSQMTWLHARIAALSLQSVAKQWDTDQRRVIFEALDRATNNFRRMALALNEYRNPRRDSFTVVKQQQVAVVNPNFQGTLQSANEKELAHAAPLLPDAAGTGVSALPHPTGETLDEDARPGNRSRKKTQQPERVQARRPQAQVRRRRNVRR